MVKSKVCSKIISWIQNLLEFILFLVTNNEMNIIIFQMLCPSSEDLMIACELRFDLFHFLEWELIGMMCLVCKVVTF
jgi:hypothetical protein